MPAAVLLHPPWSSRPVLCAYARLLGLYRDRGPLQPGRAPKKGPGASGDVSTRDGSVERLWCSRQRGELVDVNLAALSASLQGVPPSPEAHAAAVAGAGGSLEGEVWMGGPARKVPPPWFVVPDSLSAEQAGEWLGTGAPPRHGRGPVGVPRFEIPSRGAVSTVRRLRGARRLPLRSSRGLMSMNLRLAERLCCSGTGGEVE